MPNVPLVSLSTWRRVVIGAGAGIVSGAVLVAMLLVSGAAEFSLSGIAPGRVLAQALVQACDALVPWLLLWVFVVPVLLRIPFMQPWLALLGYTAVTVGLCVAATPALAASVFSICALAFLALLLGLPIVRGHGAWMSSAFVLGAHVATVTVAGFDQHGGVGIFNARLIGHDVLTGGSMGPFFGLPGLIVILWLTVQVIRHQQLLFVRSEGVRQRSMGWLNDLVVGFTIAAVAATLVLGGFLVAGQSRIALFRPSIEALTASFSGAGLPRVLADEFLYRYVLVTLVLLVIQWGVQGVQRGVHSGAQRGWIAALVAAAMVTGLHLMGPGSTPWTATSVALAAIASGLAFVWTGRLWMPVALGFGWFLFMEPIFGFTSGGPPARSSWLIQEVLQHTAWSGGVHGPDASLFGIGAWVLIVFAVWWTAGQRSR